MRVKVETSAPLPHIKAWYSTDAALTISNLKKSLCTDLQPFKHASIQPEQLVLVLDDFELLDYSPIDVVRDGDLIIVKQALAPVQHKRKAPSQEIGSPAKKRTKKDDGRTQSHSVPKPGKPDVSSSGSSSSSSESESSSDSSTDSDSETSSDSESDSSSSSSCAPSVKTSRSKAKLMPEAILKRTIAAADAPHVPPGLGKPSTHSRNVRRRRKKMYERLALTAEPASVNEIPLGTRARTLEPPSTTLAPAPQPIPDPREDQPRSNGKGKEKAQSTERPQFMMASMQNKNKRRGFKDALNRGIPDKIIFTTDEGSASPSTAPGAAQVDVEGDALMVEAALQEEIQRPERSARPPRSQAPRLIPPSEKQELGQIPSNLFVTSVDVEEGMWPAKRRNKKKKQKAEKEARFDDAWVQEEEEDAFRDGLPYDEEAAATWGTTVKDSHKQTKLETSKCGDVPDRAVIETQWDTLRKLVDKSMVSVGATVAWKSLGINMITLTPEYLVHIGRVVRSDDDALVVERYGAGEVSFGGPSAEEDDDGGATEEETFQWTTIVQGDLRIVAAH